jgi:hypothetical protein
MRKFIMGLTVLAGIVVTAAGAEAAPRFVAPSFAVPVEITSRALVVQPAQYYEEQPVPYFEDWRYREWRRREEFERFRRHEEWRHERHEAREHEHRGW